MEVDSWLTGRRGISLPFTDDCEPLCADDETFKSLVANALAFGRSRDGNIWNFAADANGLAKRRRRFHFTVTRWI